ncbi:MAG: hypothetical protein OEO77_02830 [Acidimicrobiia bacterium]|nr:hypothetical protein [Acidimicrobiia bacterium]
MRRRFIVGFMAIYLIVQLLVSVAALGRTRPARFGWQMYSYPPYSPSFSIDSGGEVTVVSYEDLAVRARGEIHEEVAIARWLCETRGADTVTATRHNEQWIVPCE